MNIAFVPFRAVFHTLISVALIGSLVAVSGSSLLTFPRPAEHLHVHSSENDAPVVNVIDAPCVAYTDAEETDYDITSTFTDDTDIDTATLDGSDA